MVLGRSRHTGPPCKLHRQASSWNLPMQAPLFQPSPPTMWLRPLMMVMSYLDVSMSRASRAPPHPVPRITRRCLQEQEMPVGAGQPHTTGDAASNRRGALQSSCRHAPAGGQGDWRPCTLRANGSTLLALRIAVAAEQRKQHGRQSVQQGRGGSGGGGPAAGSCLV